MENKELKNLVLSFITQVKNKYNDIYLDYYVFNDGTIKIWHNREDLEYENKDFQDFTLKLLNNLFYNNNYYDIFINYDYEKSNVLFSKVSCNEVKTEIQITDKTENDIYDFNLNYDEKLNNNIDHLKINNNSIKKDMIFNITYNLAA